MRRRATEVLAAIVLMAMATACTAAEKQTEALPRTPASTPGAEQATSLQSTATDSGPPTSVPSSAAAGYSPIPISSLPFPPQSTAPFSRTARQVLQAVIEDSVADPAASGVQGVMAAVVSNRGTWAGVAGVDGEHVPVVPTSMSDIASITKTVTAAEVLHLSAAGLIDLDAPASDYLDNRLLKRDPTVRQLLSHTSGIPDFTTEPEFFAAKDADPTRHWDPADVLPSRRGPSTIPVGRR